MSILMIRTALTKEKTLIWKPPNEGAYVLEKRNHNSLKERCQQIFQDTCKFFGVWAINVGSRTPPGEADRRGS